MGNFPDIVQLPATSGRGAQYSALHVIYKKQNLSLASDEKLQE